MPDWFELHLAYFQILFWKWFQNYRYRNVCFYWRAIIWTLCITGDKKDAKGLSFLKILINMVWKLPCFLLHVDFCISWWLWMHERSVFDRLKISDGLICNAWWKLCIHFSFRADLDYIRDFFVHMGCQILKCIHICNVTASSESICIFFHNVTVFEVIMYWLNMLVYLYCFGSGFIMFMFGLMSSYCYGRKGMCF